MASTSTNGNQITTTSSITDNTECSLLVTYDGSSTVAGMKIYLNGILQTVTTPRTNLSITILGGVGPKYSIGAKGNTGGYQNFFGGEIAIVQLVKKTLTASDALAMSGGGKLSKLNTVLPSEYHLDLDMNKNDGQNFTNTSNTTNWVWSHLGLQDYEPYDTLIYGSTVIYEYIGEIFGKSDSDIGIPLFSTQNSLINIYDSSLISYTDPELKSGYGFIRENVKLSNISSTDKVVQITDTNYPSLTSDFSYYGTFSLYGEVITGISRIFEISNSVSTYGVRFKYSFTSQQFIFELGLGFSLSFTQTFSSSSNSINSFGIIRKNGVISCYLNTKLIGTTSTTLDLTGANVYVIGNTGDYENFYISSFGAWSKSLSFGEIVHLHNNGHPNNPWAYLPMSDNYNRSMQSDLNVWHQFQDGSFYDSAGTLKVINWANTPTTDGTVVGFTNLADLQNNIYNINNLL